MKNLNTFTEFKTVNEAFESLVANALFYGERTPSTLKLHNCGIVLLNPKDMFIRTEWRKFSLSYAMREWEWYLSENRSVSELKRHAPMWDKMHNGNNIVNSNYGWQWNREHQLGKIIDKLKKDRFTRQAVISIYDGKEINSYEFDTPCTNTIGFNFSGGKLNMTVNMRSNDIIYGFCNDQFAFSKLFDAVCGQTGLEMGTYTHFANDMHLYLKDIEKFKLFDIYDVDMLP